MDRLIQFRLCPFSRSIRLALAELEIAVALADEMPWQWREELLALNPSGALPVLALESGEVVAGAYAISEFIDEWPRPAPAIATTGLLFPGTVTQRAEVRRLVDWFHGKLDREVTQPLLDEKLMSRLGRDGSHAARPDVLRAARTNLRYHMSYVAHLADQRRWLAGDELSYADLAAAAHLSCLDYIGEVPWAEQPIAKDWYARIKSRRSFRPLLADHVAGVPPPPSYADLDF